MTIRMSIAAAALSTVALLSGVAGAADFASDLSEAKVASQTAGRQTRAAVVPALNAAQSLSAWGKQDQARAQLTFARNTLGLATTRVLVATPVVAAPATPAASLDEQLNEAKVANLSAGREIRDTVATQLNAAQALSDRGDRVQAQDYLNYARGKLGLTVTAEVQSRDIADIYLPPSAR